MEDLYGDVGANNIVFNEKYGQGRTQNLFRKSWKSNIKILILCSITKSNSKFRAKLLNLALFYLSLK